MSSNVELVDTDDGVSGTSANDPLLREEVDFNAAGYMVAWRKYSVGGVVFSKRIIPLDSIETVASTEIIYPWTKT